MYVQLTFNRNAKAIQGRKIIFQKIQLGNLDIHIRTNDWNPIHIIYKN